MADKQTALVTGGSQGIGRGVIERLAADGYRVVSLDRQAPAALAGNETFIEVDLSQPQATAQALAQVTGRFEVSVLVNNVGTVQPAPLEEVTLDDLDQAVSLNLRCTIQCAQAVVPGMKARRYGRIVSISSRAALGKELRTVYAATKAGLQASPAPGRSSSAGTASRSTPSARGRSPPSCSSAPTRPTARAPGRSSKACRSAASARRPTSRTRWRSSPMRGPASSPDRCSTSAAA